MNILDVLTSFVNKNATINKFTAYDFMMLAQAFIYETCNKEETEEDNSGGLFCYMYGPPPNQLTTLFPYLYLMMGQELSQMIHRPLIAMVMGLGYTASFKWRIFCAWHEMCCCFASMPLKMMVNGKCLECLHSTKIHCGLGVAEIYWSGNECFAATTWSACSNISHVPTITTIVWGFVVDRQKISCLHNKLPINLVLPTKWLNRESDSMLTFWISELGWVVHDNSLSISVCSFISLLSELAICQNESECNSSKREIQYTIDSVILSILVDFAEGSQVHSGLHLLKCAAWQACNRSIDPWIFAKQNYY